MPVSNFESELKNYYEAQRRSHLTSRIEKATELMRETLLLCTVYDELFEGTISPDWEVRDDVQTLRSHVKGSEFDQIEEKLPAVLSGLQDERNTARSTLQRDLHDVTDRISGFEALNHRIGKIEATRIDALSETASNLDEVPAHEDADFEVLEERVRSQADDFIVELEAIEDALFEDFRGSDIEDLVRSLLRGEPLTLDVRSDDELLALRESELGPYVRLSLEG